MCMCNILQKGEQEMTLSPHLPPGNHLHVTSGVYMQLAFLPILLEEVKRAHET